MRCAGDPDVADGEESPPFSLALLFSERRRIGAFFVAGVLPLSCAHLSPFRFAEGALFFAFLSAAAAIDLRRGMIYDRFLLPMGICAFCALGADFLCTEELFRVFDAAFASTAGFLAFYAIAALSRGGMGGGDVKFAAVLGLWLGRALLPACALAFFSAALVALVLALRRRTARVAVPFAPFLAAGSAISFVWGEDLLSLWEDVLWNP